MMVVEPIDDELIEREIRTMYRNLKARIYELRTAKGMEHQCELANRSTVPSNSVQSIEATGHAGLKNLCKIALAVDEPLASLFDPPGSPLRNPGASRPGIVSAPQHIDWNHACRAVSEGVLVHTCQCMVCLYRRDLVGAAPAILASLLIPEPVRQLFAEATFPGLSAEDVEALAANCDEYFETQDQRVGGSRLCDVALAMHHRATTWLRGNTHLGQTAMALAALCCNLGSWAGWLATDAGRFDLAERTLTATINHARTVGLPIQQIEAATYLCRLLKLRGRAQEARALAEATLTSGAAAGAPPRMCALLRARSANACAYIGDSRGFAAEKKAALVLMDRGPRDNDPMSVREITPALMAGIIGRGHLALRQYDEAASAFYDVAQIPDPAYHRNAVHFTVLRAYAFAQQGNVADASNVAIAAVPVVLGIQSVRIHNRFLQLRNHLSAHRVSSREAADFVATYDATVAQGMATDVHIG